MRPQLRPISTGGDDRGDTAPGFRSTNRLTEQLPIERQARVALLERALTAGAYANLVAAEADRLAGYVSPKQADQQSHPHTSLE